MNYREYFKDKKITIVGLGENNKALQDAQFLARLGASVIITDTCQEGEVADALKKFKADEPSTPTSVKTIADLSSIIKNSIQNGMPAKVVIPGESKTTSEENDEKTVESEKKKKKDWRDQITFSFGGLKKEHFENRDLILRDVSISPKIPLLQEAADNGISVEVPECLFVKLAPPITLVGITGTCGKSTVAAITADILKKSFTGRNEHFYFIDPYRGFAALPLLAKIVREDVVLVECTTRLLDEFSKHHISPHIAVITNLIADHIDEYGSKEDYFEHKASILRRQTYNNFFIANDEVVDFIKAHFTLPFKGKILRTSVNIIPQSWNLTTTYYHMKENISLAMRVAEVLRVPLEEMQEVVENVKGLKGRMELVKKARGVSYYNDTTSTHPYSTLTALRCLAEHKNGIVILGGTSKGIKLDDFFDAMSQYISTVVLLPGSGTLHSHRSLLAREDIKVLYSHSIFEAAQIAKDNAGKGDVVIFSPGFPAGSVYRNEIQRGEHFVWALKGL